MAAICLSLNELIRAILQAPVAKIYKYLILK